MFNSRNIPSQSSYSVPPSNLLDFNNFGVTHVQLPVQPSQAAMHPGSLADVGCQVPLAERMDLSPVGQRLSGTGSGHQLRVDVSCGALPVVLVPVRPRRRSSIAAS